jgi:uroporphyrinogen decarboxylase
MTSKRDLVAEAFNNGRPERVPVGFWFHFVKDPEKDCFRKPSVFSANLAGHGKFCMEFQPDFVKIMTDGFFRYPNKRFLGAETAAEFGRAESIGEAHRWIETQVMLAKVVRQTASDYASFPIADRDKASADIMTFYNIFAPATLFRFGRGNTGKTLADFIAEDRDAAASALLTAAGDLAILVRRLIEEVHIDGIYFSVQDINDSRIDAEARAKTLDPANLAVLEAAKGAPYNILHICGYEGHKNDLAHYADYPAQVFNWATAVEGVPLGAGKRLFGGKPVIGGFANTTDGVLYRGSRAEVEAETAAILAEAGTKGVVLGADCTIPRDISIDRLRWVRDKAAQIN